jgi:hypothetical protein
VLANRAAFVRIHQRPLPLTQKTVNFCQVEQSEVFFLTANWLGLDQPGCMLEAERVAFLLRAASTSGYSCIRPGLKRPFDHERIHRPETL